jgi:hypothetical protein
MLRYDETSLIERLTGASPDARALFAALSAERLFELYVLFAKRTGQGDPGRLRAALDAAWAPDGDPAALERWERIAEELVPEEDEQWANVTAYAENAAAAVAYALLTRRTGDPEVAVLPARQAYEAADFAAQRQLEHVEYTDPGAEDALADRPIVQEALAGIEADLEAALSDPAPDAVPALRDRARKGAATLVELARSTP